MNVLIEKNYQEPLPINIENLVKKLLNRVPKDHLIGLGKIIIVDQVAHKKNQKSRGLYWRKTDRESAQIELAVQAIYKGMPRIVFFLPFIPKFMLANVLYHEIGHHYQLRIHGVTKKTEESFADKYRRQMLKRAFLWWRFLLFPLSPLVYLLNRTTHKDGKESKEKAKGSVLDMRRNKR